MEAPALQVQGRGACSFIPLENQDGTGPCTKIGKETFKINELLEMSFVKKQTLVEHANSRSCLSLLGS